MVKKYISRADAAKKYRIACQTIINWQRKGLLRAHDADIVEYSQVTNRPGPRVKHVYEEDQVEILAQKVIRDAATVKHSRLEAQAFELLDNGVDIIDIVKRLKINMRTAEQFRNFYERERGAVFIPARAVQALRAMGLRLTSENATETIMGLIDRVRVAEARLGRPDKPPPRRVRLVPDKP